MNINDYIASGILESYALGLTSAEESREVERMVKQHPEVKAELEQVQLALEGYTSVFEKTPPAGLKQKVMDAVAAIENNEAENKEKREARKEKREARIVPINSNETRAEGKRSSRFAAYMAAASIALLIGCGFYIYSLQQKLEAQQNEMGQLAANYKSLQDKMTEQVARNEEMIDVLKDPRNKMIRLKGMDIAPASMATVYWNPVSKEVHLTINNLPEAPEGMQYQFWAIVDGKPVDAGMIDMSDDGLHKMKGFGNAQAFAITLEKAGGSPTPNLSALYVMGSV